MSAASAEREQFNRDFDRAMEKARAWQAKKDAHRIKVGPCGRCDWWRQQGLSPFCPPHEMAD